MAFWFALLASQVAFARAVPGMGQRQSRELLGRRSLHGGTPHVHGAKYCHCTGGCCFRRTCRCLEGAASRMMKHGAAEQLSFLKKITGDLHVATCVSMSRFNKRLATVLLYAVAPVRESHGIAQKQFSAFFVQKQPALPIPLQLS